jgi:hypothetical protein
MISVFCHPSSVFCLLAYVFFSPNILAGKNRIAFRSFRNASAIIATILNGIDKSQTIGQSTKANSATGQHNTSNIAHNNNVIKTFI